MSGGLILIDAGDLRETAAALRSIGGDLDHIGGRLGSGGLPEMPAAAAQRVMAEFGRARGKLRAGSSTANDIARELDRRARLADLANLWSLVPSLGGPGSLFGSWLMVALVRRFGAPYMWNTREGRWEYAASGGWEKEWKRDRDLYSRRSRNWRKGPDQLFQGVSVLGWEQG